MDRHCEELGKGIFEKENWTSRLKRTKKHWRRFWRTTARMIITA